jgi:hypothetical protein
MDRSLLLAGLEKIFRLSTENFGHGRRERAQKDGAAGYVAAQRRLASDQA